MVKSSNPPLIQWRIFIIPWIMNQGQPSASPSTRRRLPAVPLRLITPLLLLAVAACGGKKDQKVATGNLPSNLPSLNFGGGAATPPHSMSRYEYPFDPSGNYNEDWAAQGERLAGRSTTSSAQPSATVRRSTPTRTSTTGASSAGRSHTVQRGDTLYGLARRYNTSVARIRSANGLSGDVIRPGQRLTIPR